MRKLLSAVLAGVLAWGPIASFAGQTVLSQVGERLVQDGSENIIRADRTGASVVTDAHGRFMEANVRSRLYSGGMTTTSISNVTFTTGTLGATETPIIGVWNPATSQVNLVMLQATLGVTVTAATSTGPGAFVWATSTGNAAISTGNLPFGRRSFLPSGSAAKDMTGVALTGLTNNMVVRWGAALGGGSVNAFSFVGTAAGTTGVQFTSVENFDGSVIVPPGAVLALLSTTTAVAHSAASSLLWEEVPILN